MYSAKVRKRYTALHKAAVEKLASAFGVSLEPQPAKEQKGKEKNGRTS